MTTPVRITVTGAAGQIGYGILFRIASGQMLGPNTPVILQLLEVTPALGALNGVKMELDDCAYGPLVDVITTDDANVAFGDADIALLIGAMPRKDGMERADLLTANGGIFKPQGRAIAKNAKKNVKVLVVGNPANTNAFIAMSNAAEIDPKQFTAMTRLDHNRAKTQLAQKAGAHVTDIAGLAIWGNHSATQYPDLFHATVAGRTAPELVDEAWVSETFIPTVQQRGAAIIEARGLSSAASAANAATEHMRDWALGAQDAIVSMGIYSDGSYGIPEGTMYGVPVTCQGGEYQRVTGLEIDAFSRERMDLTLKELIEERDAVAHLLK